MASFPSLSGGTVLANYPIIEKIIDGVIRSEFDGGYVQTRARYTRLRKTWQIVYHQLSNVDKALIDAFVVTVQGGADSFTWTNPQDAATYDVRFQSTPACSYVSYGRWDVSFTLEQI